MSQFKFRIWDIENKTFLENEVMWSVAKVPDGMGINPPYVPFFNVAIHCPKKYTVQQFTGLQDKNGKDIYEGDICKIIDKKISSRRQNPTIEIVQWDKERAGFNIFDSLVEEIEKLGNIFENPELLK